MANLRLAVRALAEREVAAAALIALAAINGEGDDDAIALFQRPRRLAADFDNLAHALVAQDVAG
jgi:hypothetical protein